MSDYTNEIIKNQANKMLEKSVIALTGGLGFIIIWLKKNPQAFVFILFGILFLMFYIFIIVYSQIMNVPPSLTMNVAQ